MQINNTQTAVSQYVNKANRTISWNSIYKVYVNIEMEKDCSVFNLELIDGYLKPFEFLEFGQHKMIQNTIALFVFSIKKGNKTNTFVQVPGIKFNPDTRSVLVLVQKLDETYGYQWIDLAGQSLGEPKFDLKIIEEQLTQVFN
ncbi:MAG: hypothetical protein Q8M15_15900 [Bacteroidota bacterium]|nr:hypothetical protein [Bacteroidota bacterium]